MSDDKITPAAERKPDDLPHHSASRFAPFAIALAGLWIGLGAYLKLFHGSPADLPQVVQDLPLARALTYKIAISIEFALLVLALTRPRWAWPLLTGALLTFDAILIPMVIAGVESCGCGGSAISIPPIFMLSVDTLLLVLMLALKPWNLRRSDRIPAAAVGLLLLVALTLPWMWNREAKPPASSDPAADISEQPANQYLSLDVEAWVGSQIADVPLSDWIDLDALPKDGLWIFYRDTCDHCAEHLFELSFEDDGSRPIVLLQIIDAHDQQPKVVEVLPEGEHVTHLVLPRHIQWDVTTPADMTVEDGKIVAAREGIGQH